MFSSIRSLCLRSQRRHVSVELTFYAYVYEPKSDMNLFKRNNIVSFTFWLKILNLNLCRVSPSPPLIFFPADKSPSSN